MRTVADIFNFRTAAYSALFLAFFLVPFGLFADRLEVFASSYFTGSNSDSLAMSVAGLLLAADPVLPTPSSVIATLLAAKVGFVRAALTNAAALSAACAFGYYLGRWGGWAWKHSGRTIPAGFTQWVEEYGLLAVLLCRPVPILAEASLMIAGAAGHAPRRMLMWCAVTQSILGITYAYAGAGWATGEWNKWAIFTGTVAIPLAGACLVAIAMASSKKQSR